MYIQLAYDRPLPVATYGGTERVIWTLAECLHQLGHRVHLLAPAGSRWPHGPLTTYDPTQPLREQTAPDVDLLHCFFPFQDQPEPELPYLVSIGGNASPGEVFPLNTSFRSANHARRHGAEAFVYNGLDFNAYGQVDFSIRPQHLVFLAKARWNVKNLAGARRVARKAQLPLAVLGGRGWDPLGRIRYYGMQGGERKLELLQQGMGLVFPVRWPEPFGLAVIEAMYYGLPVFATPFGSLPELVPPACGHLSGSISDLATAARDWQRYNRREIHEWVCSKFSAQHMTEGYLKLYEKVLAGKPLNRRPPLSPLNSKFRRYPLKP